MKRAARVKTIWYGAVGLAGFGFGLIGERRPFGEDMFAHPLMVFALIVAVALLTVRVAMRRPVPAVIPERVLAMGGMIGLLLFLAGNFIAAHLIGPPI